MTTDHTTHIPPPMMAALTRYVEQGIRPGGFLTAVLENDLRMAVWRADPENLVNLPGIIHYLWYEAPGICHGSPAKVAQWIARCAALREAGAAAAEDFAEQMEKIADATAAPAPTVRWFSRTHGWRFGTVVKSGPEATTVNVAGRTGLISIRSEDIRPWPPERADELPLARVKRA